MENTRGKLKLGLSMIVKDESHVILRVLESIYKHIDYWAIADTGSTDGTQEIIKKFFEEKNIPGNLIETPWVDFSTCRNISLQDVEKNADYGIWIDADEEFMPAVNFNVQIALNTGYDTISVPTKYGGVDYTRKSIWKCGKGFYWNGPIHEILSSAEEKTGGIMQGAYVLVRAEGNSWKDVTAKYTAHAKILSEYAEGNLDPRWTFYTAQSYRDAQMHRESFDWYERRTKMADGFKEEIYFSRYMMARLAEIMEKDKASVMMLYNEAHKEDPVRGETIKSLVQYLHRMKDWETAYVYTKYGLRYNQKNPYPTRILFIDNQLYDFQMAELHSVSCFHTNRVEEGSINYWLFRRQLKKGDLNAEQEKLLYNNERFFFPLEKIKHLLPPVSNSSGIPMTTIGEPNRFLPGELPKPKNSNLTLPKKKRKK